MITLREKRRERSSAMFQMMSSYSWRNASSRNRPGQRLLHHERACHPRTVRRDLEALSTDFPLYTERVDGQPDWYRFHRHAQIARGALWLVLICWPWAMVLIDFPPGRIFEASRLNSLLLRISWTIPDSLLVVSAVSTVALAGIYCVVDKMLREGDYVDNPQRAAL